MRARICLVTSTQPASNPRAVKEADALAEAGYDVRLIGAHRADWATSADSRLLAGRSWTASVIDWRRDVAPALFWKTRVRHRAARACQKVPVAWLADWCLPAAASRLTPEVTRVALKTPADLFIAHNLGALPAAAAAAARFGALLGFDAEDFHSGEFDIGDRSSDRLAVERVEARFVPLCDYLTAAAPGIADAYAALSRTGAPVCVLNVFPLASRPAERYPTSRSGPIRLYWFSQTIGPHRGLEDVVSAMGRLADGDVELHLRGTWQAGYRETLMGVAAAAGLRPTRVLEHAPSDPDEMVRLAATYDVGLAVEPGLTPNSSILLSNKIFTYLLAGTAVIATSTEGQRQLLPTIEGAAAGYDSGDAEALAAVLRRWAADRDDLEKARRAAWEYGTSRYNWDREKLTLLEIVAAVLARGSSIREQRGTAA